MNTAICVSFATPYVSSITRDESFVHSPMPLDGALAYAVYWRYMVETGEDVAPTDGKISDDLLDRVIYPKLDKILSKTTVGEILGDSKVTNEVYLVSSGFPMRAGKTCFKVGGRYLNLPTSEQLTFDYDAQPIRRRVIPERLTVLGIDPITITGIVPSEGIDTSRGGLKAIDNRITTWAVFDYVWYANVKKDAEPVLRDLLNILRFQGMGKKRSAGFGKIVDYQIISRDQWHAGLEFVVDAPHRVFFKYAEQSVLMRPPSLPRGYTVHTQGCAHEPYDRVWMWLQTALLELARGSGSGGDDIQFSGVITFPQKVRFLRQKEICEVLARKTYSS